MLPVEGPQEGAAAVQTPQFLPALARLAPSQLPRKRRGPVDLDFTLGVLVRGLRRLFHVRAASPPALARFRLRPHAAGRLQLVACAGRGRQGLECKGPDE